MKFDFHCLRRVLESVESETIQNVVHASEISGFRDAEIKHLLLAVDRGFVNGVTFSYGEDWLLACCCHCPQLTLEGVDVLGMLQDETFLNRARKRAAEIGVPFTLETLNLFRAVLISASSEGTQKKPMRYVPKPPPKTREFKKWTLRDLDEGFK